MEIHISYEIEQTRQDTFSISDEMIPAFFLEVTHSLYLSSNVELFYVFSEFLLTRMCKRNLLEKKRIVCFVAYARKGVMVPPKMKIWFL